MNRFILATEVQVFLAKHKNSNPQQIALQKSPFALVSSAELANQLDSYQRSIYKLPTWSTTPGIYFPPKINIEQSSSEKTATIKLELITAGSRIIDLTGGFGVDTYYFSKNCQSVVYCELNKDLVDIVKHNAEQFNITNIHFNLGDGLRILEQMEDDAFDYIYVDPSRRDLNQRYFLLEECQPDIVNNQEFFFQKSKTVISKISPLFDISKAILQLKGCKSIHIISVDADCKELLFVQEKGYNGPVQIHCVAITAKETRRLTYIHEQEKELQVEISEVGSYIYDPDVSVLKAGAFKMVAYQYGLSKLHQHSHLYTSDKLIEDFIGRSFKVINVYSMAELKKNKPFTKAHVHIKNFPLKVNEIRKKYKIKEGADTYLFFTTDKNDSFICIQAQKVI